MFEQFLGVWEIENVRSVFNECEEFLEFNDIFFKEEEDRVVGIDSCLWEVVSFINGSSNESKNIELIEVEFNTILDLLRLILEDLSFHDQLLLVFLSFFNIEFLGFLFLSMILELTHILIILELVLLLLLILLIELKIFFLIFLKFHTDQDIHIIRLVEDVFFIEHFFLENIFPIHSFINIIFQHFLENSLHVCRDSTINIEIKFLSFNNSNKFTFTIGSERIFTIEQDLIKDHTKTVHICFNIIGLIFEYFWCHG